MDKKIVVLVVDDSPADRGLIRLALQEVNSCIDVHEAGNSEEVADFFRRHGKYVGAPDPDVIFLDLHLPGSDGREILKSIRKMPRFENTPVCILTGSSEPLRTEDYLLTNCHIMKSLDFDEFVEIFKSLGFLVPS
jgi:two-component system, chemotaxis family, response regulator Rcp1